MATKKNAKTSKNGVVAAIGPAPGRGAREAHEWLSSLGLAPTKPRWYVHVYLDSKRDPSNVYSSDSDTVFRLEVRADEWSFLANRPRKASHLRIIDEAFPHGSDDFGLISRVPPLTSIAPFFREIEGLLGVTFPRDKAFIRTNVAGAKKAAAKWVLSL